MRHQSCLHPENHDLSSFFYFNNKSFHSKSPPPPRYVSIFGFSFDISGLDVSLDGPLYLLSAL